MLIRRPQPFAAVPGFSHNDETAPLEQLSGRCPEGAVVVNDEHAAAHWRIMPTIATHRSVASPTLSAYRGDMRAVS